MPKLFSFLLRRDRSVSQSQPLISEGHRGSHHPVTSDSGAAQHHALKKSKRMVLGALFCCGGRANRPKREHTRRRHRRKHSQQPSRTPTVRNELGGVAASIASETEYHDAREVFSVGDGDHSPLSSAQVSPRAGSFEQYHDEAYHEFESESGDTISESGSETSQSSQGFGARLVSCLSIMRASSPGDTQHQAEGHRPPGPYLRGASSKMPAGCTFARRSPSEDLGSATMCWDECEATVYQIRSKDYMRTKIKQPSSKAIYRLVAMDLFKTESKAFHVAKTFGLPPAGPPVVCKSAVGGGPEVVLPSLLIMNVQLPDYPAAFWGANDGPGQSIVYYFTLSEDFDPERFENQAALGLLQRFVSNGRESDGSPTRERLKMIPRVANLEEWARVAPLNSTEYKLLQNYNEKPVLTRPQQMFYVGPNYLEVDLDVHSYAFLARKALHSYHDRITTVVWDNAFVIQGNSPEELPEQLLGCGRIYRSDFRQFSYLSDITGPVYSPSATPATPSRPGTANGDYPATSPAAAAAAADAAVVVNGETVIAAIGREGAEGATDEASSSGWQECRNTNSSRSSSSSISSKSNNAVGREMPPGSKLSSSGKAVSFDAAAMAGTHNNSGSGPGTS